MKRQTPKLEQNSPCNVLNASKVPTKKQKYDSNEYVRQIHEWYMDLLYWLERGK